MIDRRDGFSSHCADAAVIYKAMKTSPSLKSLAPVLAATLAIVIVCGLSVRSAQAVPYVVTLTQDASGVVATGSGTIDLTGLATPPGSGSKVSYMDPFNGAILTGPATLTSIDEYAGIHGPASFGTHSGTENASSGSLDLVGIINDQFLDVPSGYISGNPLSSSSTWNGATLSSLGVTPGIYVWFWGTGTGDQTFTLDVVAPAVPDSGSTFGLLLLALGGLFGVSHCRRVHVA